VEHREPEPPTDVPAESAEPGGRRYPSTIGGACYLVVLATSTVGLWITARGDWRLGVRWIAGSLLVAAVLRLLLPVREVAGLLAPMPGGVGPMTRGMLLTNVVEAAERSLSK
jgi:hypothetical protein